MQKLIKTIPAFLLTLTFSLSTFANESKSLPSYETINLHSACNLNIELCKNNLAFTEANLPMYMSRGSGNPEKVVIIIHGTDRNANEYLHDFISNIAITENTFLGNTAVIAPHFLQVNDPFEAHELRWDQGWDHSWKYGYNSVAPASLSSYEVIDRLIKEIDKNWHPKKIIIAGHSAGAQFVQRFAHGSQVAKQIKSSLTFVVSNPSSYLYSRDVRLNNNSWSTPKDCPEFNQYIYGLKNRNAYLSKLDDDQIEHNYLQNNVIYLMGQEDTLSEDLDMSCEANTQGPNRIIRAINYFKFLQDYFPHNAHQLITIPGVGHDHIKMFSSKQFISLIVKKFGTREEDFNLGIDRLGKTNINHKTPQKLYFLMGGGIDNNQAFSEYLKAIDGGDFVVLSGKDDPLDYNDYLTNLAQANSIPLNSVTTVRIHTREGAEDPRLIKLIAQSEGIFFSGGDQWKYIDRLEGTSAHKEILKKLKTGIPFGGTSAGLAILGDRIFSAQNGSVSSEDVFNNPLHKDITLVNSLFGIEQLKNIMTDTHFVIRDRMGRLISFLANAYHSHHSPLSGLGIDEEAILVLNSKGEAHTLGKGFIYLVTPTTLPSIEVNHFNWEKLGVHRWSANSVFSINNLGLPNYYYNITDGKILSSQANGQVY